VLAIFILRWRTPILFVRVAELDDTGGWAVFRSHHRRCDEHYKWSLVLRIRIKRASTRDTALTLWRSSPYDGPFDETILVNVPSLIALLSDYCTTKVRP
jgi:hypothetical protein